MIKSAALVTLACFLCSCGGPLYYGSLPGTDYKIFQPAKPVDLQGRSFALKFRDGRNGVNSISCSSYSLDRETELEGELGARYFREYLTTIIQKSNGKIDPASPNRLEVELQGMSFTLIGAIYIVAHGFVQFKVSSSFLNNTYCADMTDNDDDAPMKWNSLVTRKTATRLIVSGAMGRAAENFVKELASSNPGGQ